MEGGEEQLKNLLSTEQDAGVSVGISRDKESPIRKVAFGGEDSGFAMQNPESVECTAE